VVILRGDSKELPRKRPDRSVILIYVAGERSTEGVYADTLIANRPVRLGGRVLRDDYL
jgi:hypothetical protein